MSSNENKKQQTKIPQKTTGNQNKVWFCCSTIIEYNWYSPFLFILTLLLVSSLLKVLSISCFSCHFASMKVKAFLAPTFLLVNVPPWIRFVKHLCLDFLPCMAFPFTFTSSKIGITYKSYMTGLYARRLAGCLLLTWTGNVLYGFY